MGGQASSLVDDEADLVEEPGVDASRLVDPLDGDAPSEGRLQMERPVGGGDGGPPDQFVIVPAVVGGLARIAVEAEAAPLQRPEALLQRLREGAPDGHGLPDGLHAGAEDLGNTGELLE